MYLILNISHDDLKWTKTNNGIRNNIFLLTVSNTQDFMYEYSNKRHLSILFNIFCFVKFWQAWLPSRLIVHNVCEYEKPSTQYEHILQEQTYITGKGYLINVLSWNNIDDKTSYFILNFVDLFNLLRNRRRKWSLSTALRNCG